jgi:hypothetical protein
MPLNKRLVYIASEIYEMENPVRRDKSCPFVKGGG